jgi:hypothetical protein
MKNRFPREFYIPKGAIKVADKQSTAVVYLYEILRCGVAVPCLVAFHGKADKPDFQYSYGKPARRDVAIKAHFEATRAAEQRRKDRQAERKAFANPFKVGDVLNTCWGYDQTNVEYFQVTEVKGKHVIVREIASEYEATGSMQGRTVPVPGIFKGEPLRRLAQRGGVKIGSCQRATPTEYTEVAGMRVYRSNSVSSYA